MQHNVYQFFFKNLSDHKLSAGEIVVMSSVWSVCSFQSIQQGAKQTCLKRKESLKMDQSLHSSDGKSYSNNRNGTDDTSGDCST